MDNRYTFSIFYFVGKMSLILCFTLFSFVDSFGLSVSPDNLYHRYYTGDTIRYEIVSDADGTVDYLINQDPLLPILAQGSVQVVKDVPVSIAFVPNHPGNYFCIVTMGAESETTVAEYARRELTPIAAAPSDFDTYWAGIRSELDAVPIDAQVVEDMTYGGAYSTTYQLSLGSIHGHRAYAVMTVPDHAGPFTGLIRFPPFGNSDAAGTADDIEPMAERLGSIVISVSIHDSPVNVNLPQDEIYNPDITASDTVYYHWAMAAGMRAIDYLETRSDFDGIHVGVYGVSQGAGLAMLFAGIDSRVDLVTVSNPIMSQHDGLSVGKPSGFPKYIKNVLNDPTEMNRILSATKYFDVVFALQRFHGPVLVATSLKDEVTPSEASYVAYNQLQGKLVHVHSLEGLHSYNPEEYNDGRFDMIRRYFPTDNASWPWPGTNIGYEANAGNNQTTNGLQAVLSGTIDDNGTTNPANIPVHWELVSGPGTVSFTDSTDYVTTATFSQSGVYNLRFVGEQIADLTTASKYLTIEDRVEINVCPNNDCGEPQPLPVELFNFSVSKMKNQVRVEWHTLSEKNNLGFRIMRSRNAIDWVEIGFQSGAGDAHTEKRYVFMDDNADMGMNYYQLIQVDYDGQEQPSEIRTINFYKTLEISPDIYPNPAKNQIFFSGLGDESLMLNVLNQSGQTVLVGEVKNQQSMDISDLSPGTYFFRFSDGIHAYFRKVTVNQ